VSLLAFPTDWERALCIVAHPDDLEYGAAAAIARWTADGKHVSYLLVTRGEAGIDAMEPSEGGPLREAEERARHTDTWGGLSFNMADHRHVGLAALDAARDAGNRWIFTDAGEPWPGVRRVAMGGSPQPTHFVDVGATIEIGIDSLRRHAAYIAGLGTDFDPDAFLRGNARAAGEAAGCEYAATFQLYEL
jgi:LmbE family N-acetylglucosaminyl deacetylase